MQNIRRSAGTNGYRMANDYEQFSLPPGPTQANQVNPNLIALGVLVVLVAAILFILAPFFTLAVIGAVARVQVEYSLSAWLTVMFLMGYFMILSWLTGIVFRGVDKPPKR